MNDQHTSKIMQWLNQKITTLHPDEKKEFIYNSEYAGRKVYINIRIDALNNTPKESSGQ